jgi:acyl carrier protein
MMLNAEEKTKLLELLGRIKKVDAETVRDNLENSVDSLGIDSLDMVETMMLIEEEFKVYLDMEGDYKSITNVGQLVDWLELRILEARQRAADAKAKKETAKDG